MLGTYKKWILILIITGIYLPCVCAEEIPSNPNLLSFIKSHYVLSLSGGTSWESAGQAQTLNFAPEVIKTYTTNKPRNTLPSGELFLGIRNTLSAQLEGQLGLALIATGHATLSGNIWDDADPTFNNFTYQYKVNHTAIDLKGKLLGHWNLPVIPWISASVGLGFNKAYGFNNTPTIYEAVQTPNFASNTTRAFTYTIGIGVQRQLNAHWQIGAGYEFSDWGKSQLGKAFTESSNGLSLSHLYTNSLLFNFSYL